jgi:hypothetical protein
LSHSHKLLHCRFIERPVSPARPRRSRRRRPATPIPQLRADRGIPQYLSVCGVLDRKTGSSRRRALKSSFRERQVIDNGPKQQFELSGTVFQKPGRGSRP